MRFGLIGPSYTARSSAVADEETINLFPEIRESSGAVAPSREYGGQAAGGNKSLLWTPGLSVFCALPQSPVRGSWSIYGRLFVVAGAQLYEVGSGGTYTALGAVANDGTAVSIAANGIQLLIVSAGRAYCLTLATNALLDVTAQLAGVPVKVDYSDTYFIVQFANTNKYQISDILDGTSWPGTYVNAVSVFPENITSIILNHRELWVFGAQHAQPYQNTGSAEVFDVIPGALIETGCVGTFATCKLDNSVFWISEDERGGRMAWRSNGYTPQRISTHAVEIDLASYPTLAGMTTYSYQDGGHLFWVLYIPGSNWSWVYDVAEQAWHKRASWSNGKWGPHNSWNHVYAFGQHLVGDWASGNLYALSLNNFDDNGTLIRRQRRSPTVEDEGQWLQHAELNLDFDMGNLSSITPTDTTALASSLYGPSLGGVAADTSLGGATWSNAGNVLLNDGSFATAVLNAALQSARSSTSTGTSTGGGVAWSTPGNVDSTTSFATVTLSAGGPPIFPTYSGSVSNAASPTNQYPANQTLVLGGFPPTPATAATVYVKVSGDVTASQGGGVLSLDYSTNNGATWTPVTQWNATFASTTVPITITGITDLSGIQLRLTAAASCAPTGYSNVTLNVPSWYAVVAGSGQPTAQTLSAAVTGLSVPAGSTIRGIGISFNADYAGVAPSFQVGLSVGNTDPVFTLTTTPAIYAAGGSSALWGYDGWTNATLASLKVNFFTNSTGSTTVNVNQLQVTVYYVQTVVSSDALDVTQYGFAVPSTSNPQGVMAAIRAYADVAGATVTAQLLQGNTPVGNPQTLPLPTTATVLTFGSLITLLGASLASADVNAAGFGLRITASTSGGISANVFVGHATLQLYCPPANPNLNAVSEPPMLLDGNGNPRPPQVMVRWSDDRGKTWSNEHVINLGMAGQYKARGILRRLGRSRGRVYEISGTDPIPWVLVDGYLRLA